MNGESLELKLPQVSELLLFLLWLTSARCSLNSVVHVRINLRQAVFSVLEVEHLNLRQLPHQRSVKVREGDLHALLAYLLAKLCTRVWKVEQLRW